MTNDRKPGFYWVIHAAFDQWQVAEYFHEDGWMLAGIDGSMGEGAFEVIGDRIPAPDEPWQTVPANPTHEMHLAGESSYEGGMSECPDPISIYKDMLSAAPKP